MNSKSTILAIVAFAALASTGVRADEADGSQYALQFEGTRTRAEVLAEAVKKSNTFAPEPAGSRVGAPLASDLARDAVRNDAAVAQRAGKISYGEASSRG